MASLSNNNIDYEIRTNGDFAEILRYFESDFIKSIVNDAIDNRFRVFVQSVPNMVESLELKFKNNYIDFPQNIDEINKLRDDTYRSIINIICERFNLSINFDSEIMDTYTLASYMYNFFVSGFTSNMISFFSQFLINEKNSIYDSLNLVEFKKNKDSSTLHAKKLYSDPKLIAILGNLGYVLSNISSIDIALNNIFEKTYSFPEPYNFLSSTIYDNGDFYKQFYSCYCNPNNEYNPAFITGISISLQQSLISQPNIFISEE